MEHILGNAASAPLDVDVYELLAEVNCVRAEDALRGLRLLHEALVGSLIKVAQDRVLRAGVGVLAPVAGRAERLKLLLGGVRLLA